MDYWIFPVLLGTAGTLPLYPIKFYESLWNQWCKIGGMDSGHEQWAASTHSYLKLSGPSL
jgi:hypothetical protein